MAPNPTQLAPQTAPDPLETSALDAVARRDASADAFHADALRGARRAGTKWRAISRYTGLGIFLFGVFLLGYVFLQALDGFKQFSDVGRLNSQFNSMAGDSVISSIQAVAAVLGKEILRVLYLFILGYIASAIAARGIGFFAASEAVIDEAVL